MAIIQSASPMPTIHSGSMSKNSADSSKLSNEPAPLPIRANTNGSLNMQNISNVDSSRRNEIQAKKGAANGPSVVNLAAAQSTQNIPPEQQAWQRSRTDARNLSHRPRVQISRTKTDYGPAHQANKTAVPAAAEEASAFRHGWEAQNDSSEYLGKLSQEFYMYFTDKRHENGGIPQAKSSVKPPEKWKEKDRQKTVSAALVLCLNIGVDPPDIVKTNPTATMECWHDPASSTTTNAKLMEIIGKKLQEQYENMSIKTRYKQYLDPSVEETKKFCISLRRNAKEERVLYHYNGHGVPLPTPSGEIWVFNKDYTQYIPVSMWDLQAWLGGPSFYVWDASHAGNVLENFDRFVEKHLLENAEIKERDPNAPTQNYGNNIQLAACGKSEMLPTNPDLPADLFTCCLTTPIDISLRHHVLENPLPSPLRLKDVSRVPGRAAERRSPMGELNWILTAITDTIAWNVLPPSLFRALFRQDLMVAALFRNFLVAQRIMRVYGCHPQSAPELPRTFDHPLWEAWDLAIEMVLSQLPTMMAAEDGGPPYEYQYSNFFAEQLTAFEHYLEQGALEKEAPTQLPIVLQVLLSQVHRVRALVLLSKFLDLGPWAVSMALTIGIFPYVVKLLQSPAVELRPLMIFIWSRIVAVDIQAVQQDLLKDNGYQYFTSMIHPQSVLPVTNQTEHRAMSAFVTAMFCRGFPQGKNVCLSPELFENCIHHFQSSDNPLLRQWSCLCISTLWEKFPDAKWVGIRCLAHHRLCELIINPVPEVRAAAIHALTNFLGIPDLTSQVVQNEELIASVLISATSDGSVMVRKELLVFFSTFVKRYLNRFLVAAFETLAEERDDLKNNYADPSPKKSNGVTTKGHQDEPRVSQNTVQGAMWYHLLTMSVDGYPQIAQNAGMIVDYVYDALLASPLAEELEKVAEEILGLVQQPNSNTRQPSAAPLAKTTTTESSTGPPGLPRNESYLSTGLRRNASVAAALKYLGLGGSEGPDYSPVAPDGASNNANQSHTTSHQKRMAGQQRPGVPAEWSTPPNHNDHTSTTSKYQQGKVPVSKGFEKRDHDKPVKLPLKSTFFDWSIEYFQEPQMRPMEADEPGSNEYNLRLWRRARNEKLLLVTQPLKGVGGSKPWDVNTAFFNNQAQPTKMCFSQFEDHLVVADDRDGLSIWNWEKASRLSRFANGNPKGTRINEACFINEDDNAFLMTGSSDGVIKIYRNYDSEQDVELVTSFRALNNMIPSNKNAGLVLDWHQGQGNLLIAGDVKVIKIWNAATEMYINEIPARSGSCITSLTMNQVDGHVFAAGYGDGAVRIFDDRIKPAAAMTQMWRIHQQWVINVHLQRGGYRELVSGSRNGEVKLWDIRHGKPVRESVGTEDIMRTLSVHEHAPIYATGSDTHALSVFNVNGSLLNTIRPYSPILSASKSSPIACTAFHPHKMQLATGSLGHGNVEVFTCPGSKGKYAY